ncbi:hypothetical protein [Streptomyces lydicus]|uniref:hypothetical protein n=1 Tax=Streptomyces lydicus TaxID=47763 RepID=UPI00341C30D6
MLIADPGLPTDIVREICESLPSRLHREVSEQVDWRVRELTASVIADEQVDASELAQLVSEQLKDVEEDWDLGVILTDLPRRQGMRPVIAELSRSRKVALVSLPALGSVRLVERAGDMIVDVIAALTKDDRENPPETLTAGERITPGQAAAAKAPDRRDLPDRYVVPGLRGHVRLVSGMVKANRPWRLFTSLSRALAGVFATAAFALINSGVWQVCDFLGWWRQNVLALLCVAALTTWIIVDHGLWERPDGDLPRARARLYNLVTAVTIGLGVLCLYAALFVTLTAASLLMLDTGAIAAVLKHPTEPIDCLELAWFVASVALVGGAFGSGLEDSGAVRNAAYGHRQRQRQSNNDPSAEGES